MVGGEIYVKKIPSMRVVDIATAVAAGATHRLIGIRPGEKLHEQMISRDDSFFTYEYEEHFKILPALNDMNLDPALIKDGRKVPEGFSYTSENNPEWMSIESLRQWIEDNRMKLDLT
jgi:FlaA1/EpsC-like NDP-sugar epimerase